MDQRLSLMTLAVADLAVTRRFYADGLGWEPMIDVPGEVLMFRVGEHVILSFWDLAAFTAEVGEPVTGGIAPVTLAHNVASAEEVDGVIARAQAAGAQVTERGTRREWGGYSGYVADPDGYRWEIAYAPGEITDIVVP